MGTDTTFSDAVAAIVAHHAKLYNLLLAALPAYSGGKKPPRKERISHILNCEENDAHLLLERLATAAKAAPRGSLGEHPDILIAECRDFLDFLEEHLPSPDCAAAHRPSLVQGHPSRNHLFRLRTGIHGDTRFSPVFAGR